MASYQKTSRNDPVVNAMSFAVCGEMWKGNMDFHSQDLRRAWKAAWLVVDGPGGKGSWDERMRDMYSAEIAEFESLTLKELRAMLKMMDYNGGAPFFCAVMALGAKMEKHLKRSQRERSTTC